MKTFCSANKFLLKHLNSRFSFSTAAAASSSTEPLDSLYARIIDFPNRKGSIGTILKQWVNDGKAVESKNSLQGIIKRLRRLNRNSHALEVSKYMGDCRCFPLTAGDHAVRLNLLYNVEGIEQAENYFDNIPEQYKVHQTYGALLNCYYEEKSINKAESIFKTMQQLKRLTSFPFCILMSLYSQTGQHDKVETIYQEMKEMGVPDDTFTQNIRLQAYANALNIEKMKVVLKQIEERNAVVPHKYAIAARAYIKIGLIDKSLEYIKKAEKVICEKDGRSAWGFLITLYAEIGRKDDMYRIWNANQSTYVKPSNSMYMCMISGLLKIGHIGDAEAFYSEWKSQFTVYDIRISKVMINAYCEKGLLSKVEPLLSKVAESGEMLSSNTWAVLADAYLKVNQISKAVDMMKEIEVGKTYWKPSNENVNMGLQYYEEKIDVEGAEEFIKLVKKLIPLSRNVYEKLISLYSLAGRPISEVIKRMKADGFDLNEEMEKNLNRSYED